MLALAMMSAHSTELDEETEEVSHIKDESLYLPADQVQNA